MQPVSDPWSTSKAAINNESFSALKRTCIGSECRSDNSMTELFRMRLDNSYWDARWDSRKKDSRPGEGAVNGEAPKDSLDRQDLSVGIKPGRVAGNSGINNDCSLNIYLK